MTTAGTGPITGHIYTHPGTYTALVTATNSLGSALSGTFVEVKYGTISGPPAPHMLYMPLIVR